MFDAPKIGNIIQNNVVDMINGIGSDVGSKVGRIKTYEFLVSLASTTESIDQVDYDNSYIDVEYQSTSNNITSHNVRVELETNGNEVTIYGGTAVTGGIIIVKVIEMSKLKSKNVYTGAIGNATINVTTPSVDVEKTLTLVTASTTDSSTAIREVDRYSYITTSTNVEVYVDASSSTYHLQVIEFN